MFVNERLVYVELHKTGCTHIRRWLGRLVDGETIGKHNRVPPELWDRFIVGSVRNPWEWYVSLWAFGCLEQGAIHQRTTRGLDLRYTSRQLHGEMGRRRSDPRTWVRQVWNDLRKPVADWKDCYRDPGDPVAFRSWLAQMMDPDRRFDLGEGFGFSPISGHSGLLTYRFLKLFTRAGEGLYRDRGLGSPEGARRLWETERLVDHVIRNEALEQGVLEALELAGYEVSEQQRNAFLSASATPSNASSRREASFYYDSDTLALVGERESLVIDAFGYESPE